MTTTYDIGDTVKLTFTVRVDGVLTNATVALTVTEPDGTTSNPSTSNPSTGTYTATVTPDTDGPWLYAWTATGAATTTEDGQFRVVPAATAKIYATVDDLRDQFGDDNSIIDTRHLQRALNAASRAVDRHCGRRFWKDNTATARTYRPDENTHTWIDDLWTITGLVVKTDPGGDGSFSETWTTSDYQLEPLNASADAGGDGAYAWWQISAVDTLYFPIFARRVSLQVTAKWGWSAVPDQVVEATLLKAASLFKRKDAPFGVAGFGEFGAVRISRMDPDVIDLLRPFVKSRPRTLHYDPQHGSLFHGGRR